MKIAGRLTCLVVTLIAAASCGEGRDPVATSPARSMGASPIVVVRLSPRSDTVTALGQLIQYAAAITDSVGRPITGASATWNVSDTAIVSITSKGLARSRRVGDVLVFASYNGVADTGNLVVRQVPARIVLSPTARGVFQFDSISFAAVVQDRGGNAIPDAVTSWVVAQPLIARITAEGVLYPIRAGRTTVTASSGSVKALATVSVLRRRVPAVQFIEVRAEFENTCARTAGHEVYCWGQGQSGEIGDSVPLPSLRPTPTYANHLFRTFATGWSHSCGVLYDGTTACWGRSRYGETGTRDTISMVPRRLPWAPIFRQLEAASVSTCGITPDGKVWCWGLNPFINGFGSDTVPYQISFPVPIRQLQIGSGPSCALGSDGAVYCPGTYTEIGARSVGPRPFVQFAVGNGYACAITDLYAAFCWGNNHFGQLGSGDRQWYAEPHRVVGGYRFSAIYAGLNSTCAIRKDTGRAMCWGHNERGELGTNTGDVNTPTPVAFDYSYKQLSMSWRSTCGVTVQSYVYCWGWPTAGALGNGARGEKLVPTFVAGQL